MAKSVRVALAGVGNCAASVVQGRELHALDDVYPGGMQGLKGLGPVGAIRFVAAFDLDARKVGSDLSEAVHAPPNNAPRFADVPRLGVPVRAGIGRDGLGPRTARLVPEVSVSRLDEVIGALREAGTDVLLSLLPAGAEEATEAYAEAALHAGCAFVNGASTTLARDERWRERFVAAGLPLVGDDLKAQLGATIVHQTLVRLLGERGVTLERTHQINAGGNMNFVNLGDPARSEGKTGTKVGALATVANRGDGLAPENCYAGMADYIPALRDRKIAHIRLEGRTLGGQQVDIEVRMDVPDSINGVGAAFDAIRLTALARRAATPDVTGAVNALLMKEPAEHLRGSDAMAIVRAAADAAAVAG